MRVSNLSIKQNFIGNIRKNYNELSRVETQLVTGQRINRPSIDPAAAINSVYHRTRVRQIEQYQSNIGTAGSLTNFSHDKISSSTEVMQRIRSLAVQSANGIYGKDERTAMAMEIEELLKEMVQTGNSMYKDTFLFAGSNTREKPFRVFEETREGLGKPLIQQVEYTGNGLDRTIEIDKNDQVDLAIAGNKVFWADTHTVVALKDATGYTAGSSQKIRIDGQTAEIDTGDNIDAVVQKINDAIPSVNAFRREMADGRIVFGIESNYPHRIMMEDIEGGSVLQDIGVLSENPAAGKPGRNLHPNTIQSGSSVFDVIIRFRDSLLENRTEKIGSRDLASIDKALGVMLSSQARISSVKSRIDLTEKKLARESELVTERMSANEDVDIAQATINFNQLQNVHRVSLMTQAKLTQNTLMDYIR